MKKVLATCIIALLFIFTGSSTVEAKSKIKKYSLKSQKKCWKPKHEKKVG